jgi:hypothetical protein
MFSRDILQSDSFIDLSNDARLLYIYLNMDADDDGFIENPKGVARLAGCDLDSIKELKTAGFVLECEKGVFVITHWKIHNLIRQDRKKETRFQGLLKKLETNTKKEYALR